MNIEKSNTKKTFMFHDNLPSSNSDVNISQRPKNIQPNSNSNHHHHSKHPNLNESRFEQSKSNPRPKLSEASDNKRFVPMEGLDLLANQKRFDKEEFSNGKESVQTDDGVDDTSLLDDDDADDSISTTESHPLGSGGNKSNSSSNSNNNSRSRSASSSRSDSSEKRKKTYEEIQQEKQKYLFILDRLIKAGYMPTRKYTMASNLDDIIYEVTRLKRERDIDKSIKFQRKLLMAFTSGVEFMNNKFDPVGAKLDDWSEHVMESIGDYDEVFEELHDKYADKIEVAPELKMIMMVSGSAFMYHLSQTLFKSATPGLQEILKNNPDIMRNISQAALNGMGKNDPELAGAFNFMTSGGNMANNARAGNMKGPVGVDDILNELENDAGVRSNPNNNNGNGNNNNNNNNKQRRSQANAINIDL